MPSGEFQARGYYGLNPASTNGVEPSTFNPQWAKHHIVWPVGPDNSEIVKAGWLSLSTGFAGATGHLWFIGTDSTNGKPVYIQDFDFKLVMDVRSVWTLPPNTDKISLTLLTESDNPVAWCLELQSK